jgi:hypothetical protein
MLVGIPRAADGSGRAIMVVVVGEIVGEVGIVLAFVSALDVDLAIETAIEAEEVNASMLRGGFDVVRSWSWDVRPRVSTCCGRGGWRSESWSRSRSSCSLSRSWSGSYSESLSRSGRGRE